MKLNRYLQFLCVLSFLGFVVRVYVDLSICDVTLHVPNSKDLYNGNLNGTEAFKSVYPQEVISMEEYLRFYQLNERIHHSCLHTRRPHPEEVSWKKGVYQHGRMKLEDFEGMILGVKQW